MAQQWQQPLRKVFCKTLFTPRRVFQHFPRCYAFLVFKLILTQTAFLFNQISSFSYAIIFSYHAPFLLYAPIVTLTHHFDSRQSAGFYAIHLWTMPVLCSEQSESFQICHMFVFMLELFCFLCYFSFLCQLFSDLPNTALICINPYR